MVYSPSRLFWFSSTKFKCDVQIMLVFPLKFYAKSWRFSQLCKLSKKKQQQNKTKQIYNKYSGYTLDLEFWNVLRTMPYLISVVNTLFVLSQNFTSAKILDISYTWFAILVLLSLHVKFSTVKLVNANFRTIDWQSS